MQSELFSTFIRRIPKGMTNDNNHESIKVQNPPRMSGGDDVAMYEMVGQSVSSSDARPTADHSSFFTEKKK